MGKKVVRVIGWNLFGYGILGALYMLLAMGPVPFFLSLPFTVACVVGGWKLAHRKQKSV